MSRRPAQPESTARRRPGWLAYVSDEDGGNQVYVRPPGPGGKWQVSKGGGTEPRWSSTGKEIFFRAGQSLMAASVQAGATFSSGEARELFSTSAVAGGNLQNYDVSRDGKSFVLVKPPPMNDRGVVMLLNWFDNLPARPRWAPCVSSASSVWATWRPSPPD